LGACVVEFNKAFRPIDIWPFESREEGIVHGSGSLLGDGVAVMKDYYAILGVERGAACDQMLWRLERFALRPFERPLWKAWVDTRSSLASASVRKPLFGPGRSRKQAYGAEGILTPEKLKEAIKFPGASPSVPFVHIVAVMVCKQGDLAVGTGR